MALLKDLADDSKYLTPLKDQWYQYLDNLCAENEWVNCDELKSFVDGKLDAMKTKFQQYLNGLDVSVIKRVLIPLYVYCVLKNMTIVGENNPPTISILIPPDDDLRRKYSYWTYELWPFNSTLEWFEFTDDPESAPPEKKGKAKTKDKYDEDLEKIVELAVTDTEAVSGLGSVLGAISNSFMLHMTYVKPKVSFPSNFDPKPYILNTMHLQDILDEFGWTVPEIYPM